ncbi:hypothetical protein RI129_001393 [Pyrocoelia pectoralis]|uniref:THAP-type domain-containing protein n=1 Tax=Pyrocoelia pectoralis TaxID=417401 RepID=A0AAN7VU73_9COLE
MTSYTGVSAKLVFTNDCFSIMEPSKRCYKWCFVPICTNTTFTTPEKTFVTMPRDVKIRKMWFKAARRDYSKITSLDFYCCEDHFDWTNFCMLTHLNMGNEYLHLHSEISPQLRICSNIFYRKNPRAERISIQNTLGSPSKKCLFEGIHLTHCFLRQLLKRESSHTHSPFLNAIEISNQGQYWIEKSS